VAKKLVEFYCESQFVGWGYISKFFHIWMSWYHSHHVRNLEFGVV
jgi:hypothetical protein